MDIFYIAKTNPTSNSKAESIQKHTSKLEEKYEELKSKYYNILNDDLWHILWLAVRCHDLGKANAKFQNKLYSKLGMGAVFQDTAPKKEEIPHNYLSGAFLDVYEISERYGNDLCQILCMAIYYHHTRRDFLDDEIGEYIASHMSIDPCLPGFIEEYANTKPCSEFLSYIIIKNMQPFGDLYKKYILIKGLLNRIDYAASAELEYIEGEAKTPISALVNSKLTQLREVQKYMYENQDKSLIITAATGIGKTEAALLWLGSEKGFYTLPLKVSINAIYNRVKKFGFNEVALLHSDALSMMINESDDEQDIMGLYTKAKQFTEPLTFCTIDQILKCVFRHHGSELYLATLAYSKLVIDEIQMYSPDLIAVIIAALKNITWLGGKYAIITATFPEILYDLMDEHKIPYTRADKVYHDPETPQRHKISVSEGDFDYDLIVKKGKQEKVLVIANTVSKAQKTFELLKERDAKVSLLHSRFIKKHRNLLEKEVLEFAPNRKDRDNEPGIWVSTQIVEASLDIDFDILFTEMCSIDSLLQRMGRVFRNRVFEQYDANVYIYDNRNGVGDKNVINPQIYEFSLKAVTNFNGEILLETDDQDYKQEMIDMVFSPKLNSEIKDSNYYKAIRRKTNVLLKVLPFEFDKKKVDEDFRDINSIQVMPISVYEGLEERGIIQEWKKLLDIGDYFSKYKIIDQIMGYTVSVRYFSLIEAFISKKDNLIFENSRISLLDCQYEFDETSLTGNGVIFKKVAKGDFDTINNFN